MLQYLNFLEKEIRNRYMIRKSKLEKDNFRKFLTCELTRFGHTADEVKYKGSTNVESNIQDSKIIFTAHYDTPPKNISLIFSKVLFISSSLFGNSLFLNLVSFILIYIIPLWVSTIYYPQFTKWISIVYLLDIVLFLIGYTSSKNKNNMIDNTSGICGALSLAKIFSGDNNIGFMFFDNEEYGYLGSKKASKYLNKKYSSFKDKLIVNLDCICSANEDDSWVVSFTSFNKDTIHQKDQFLKLLSEHMDIIPKEEFASSDYLAFKKNTSISFGKYSKNFLGRYYLKNIHSEKDTKLYLDNILHLISAIHITSTEYLK